VRKPPNGATSWPPSTPTAYPDNLQRKKTVYNHNAVALAGEYLRLKQGLASETNFFTAHLAHQQQYLTSLGMYEDRTCPWVTTSSPGSSRHHLVECYSTSYSNPRPPPRPSALNLFRLLRDRLWKGA